MQQIWKEYTCDESITERGLAEVSEKYHVNKAWKWNFAWRNRALSRPSRKDSVILQLVWRNN